MARVLVNINGLSYEIACEEGQQDSVLALGQAVDDRVKELINAVGQAGEARLLAMASLLFADEVQELKAELASLRETTDKAIATALATGAETAQISEANRLKNLETTALRVESIAQRLEAS